MARTPYFDEIAFNQLHQPGQIVIYDAFTSSSKKVYDSSSEYQLVIQSKHGKDISDINEKELEVLFRRGSMFLVTNRVGNTIYLEEVG